MNVLQSMLIAISMYSKIPVPGVKWNKENMKYVMCFFPLVGGITGVLVWVVGTWLLHSGCSVLFFGAVMTLLPLGVSGGIHMDGFMDTVDALASYGTRERKLDILKDTHAGAFSVLAVCCYFLWSLGLWSEVTAEMLPVVACGYVLSRACSGCSVVTFSPAKDSGLVAAFGNAAQKKTVRIVMVVYMAAAAAGMFVCNGRQAFGAILATILSCWHYRRCSKKHFGGITGDLAGYFLQLCELFLLTGIVLAGGVLWKSH